MKKYNKILNDIAEIHEINNQTAIIVATKYSTETNSFTSLGGAMGNVTNSKELNKLLNEATNCSYQNMQVQTPNFSESELLQRNKNNTSSSNYQPAQSITTEPISKRQSSKQYYSHSTTLTASPKQQDLIETLCNEKGKDLHHVLAPYNKQLSTITSAEANEIIQKMKKIVNIQDKSLILQNPQ